MLFNEPPDSCGDGQVSGNEQCDQNDLDGQNCNSLGFSGGTLACSDFCTFDTSACCTDNTSYQCFGGDVYWYDSCGNLGEKKQECGLGDCLNLDANTAQCEQCECNAGACCDGCNYYDANHVCQQDAQSEYACPWGTDPGDDVGLHTRDRYCSGSSSSCNGSYGAWSNWAVADACSLDEVCAPGDSTCNPAPCVENDYYQCHNGDVYWYDSCDNLGAKKQECGAGACMNTSGQTAECEICECDVGVCCDGCNYRPANYVCDNDAQSEYACPWGTDPGDEVGLRTRDRYCSGASSSCTGSYSAWSGWSVADFCSNAEVCEPGDATCNPAPCAAADYWSPSFDSDIDNTGLQSDQSINVAIQMQVRETGSQLEFRVCKPGDVFQEDVKVAIYDAATNSQAGALVQQLSTAGQTCSAWVNMVNDAGYLEGEVFGGSWNLVSPSWVADQWPTWGGCAVNGQPWGTCWSGIDITLTRTCKGL